MTFRLKDSSFKTSQPATQKWPGNKVAKKIN